MTHHAQTAETILVVEDDPVVAMLERRRLERAGYRVAIASTAEEAKRLVMQGGVGLIVLDYSLSKTTTGLEFYDQLKSSDYDLPVIMVTGASDEGTVIAALRAGVRDFVTKSKEYLEYLPDAVERVLTQERTAKALAVSKRELKESASLLMSTLEATADGLLVVDRQGRITSFNTRFVEMWGIPRTVLDSRDNEQAITCVLEQLLAPDDFVAKIKELYATPLATSVDTLDFKDGRVFERVSRPQILDGQPVGRVWSFRDVTERKQAEARLSYMAHRDALTDLPNRTLLHDRLNQALRHAQRSQQMLAILFLDLDRFKSINDTLGHVIGDLLLKAVAQRLLSCVRETDTVARFGGDEFTVVLTNLVDVADAGRVAQKIIDAFSHPFQLGGPELFVTASIGIAMYPSDEDTTHGLFKNADIAMYRAKEQGRNNFQFYTVEMNSKAFERLTLENSLRHALARNELSVYYQPQVNLKTGEISGAEALLRWHHSEIGPISPASFVPIAEETGLIVPIGEWVLRTACAQTQTWREAGYDSLRIAVNLSSRQFKHNRLVETIGRVLHETRLPPRCLDIELTESIIMQNAEATVSTLRALSGIGIQFSVDDFGTGYSSLSYLKRFPIHILKIDPSFVRDVTVDTMDAAIATSIISLAHSLHLTVIAEGVETEAQLAFLRTHGCDEMQGYFFSRALTAQEFTRLLTERRRLVVQRDAA